jgi:putative colanic acid biosynthesis UDP-glucose lipid carrier transferase
MAVFYFSASILGLYGSWRSEALIKEVWLIVRCWIALILALVVLVYGYASDSQHVRALAATWWVAGFVFMLVFRIAVRFALRSARASGRNSRTAAIVGAGPVGALVAQRIQSSPWMGIEVVGYYDDAYSVGYQPNPALDAKVMGGLESFASTMSTKRVDQVYITLPMRAEDTSVAIVDALRDWAVEVHFVPDVFIFNLINSRIRDVGGLPTISVYESPHAGVNALLKRAEDILVSAIALSLSMLPMLAIAVGVKLTSEGPVLFRQRRFGLNGEEILVWKFRTMTTCDDGDRQATAKDPRVTNFGRFLRRTSLDELPQFFNVLQGSMSVVGPRPHPVALNEQYRGIIRGYMLRHLVKPGITGLAQVHGWRGETDTLEKMRKRVEYDMEYINTWSVWLDLKIVALTIVRGFVHRNAY